MYRIKFLKLVVLAALGVVLVRLFSIQILEHAVWAEKAAAAHTILNEILANRGDIYIMDAGKPKAVVMNQTVYAVIIDPAVTEKARIAEVLEKHAKEFVTANLDEVYARKGLRYFVVAKNMGKMVADKIAEEGVAGVRFQQRTRRVYPEGEMGSGVLGFVNADGVGQYGVEGALNKQLAGTNGILKTVADVNKVALSIGRDNVRKAAVDGKDMVLTIDRGVQRGVEEILAEEVKLKGATHAAGVVMEPATGKVLAMANVPTYNPGDYGRVKDASAYVNHVTEVPYEPASVCKTFAFAGAINEGRMTESTTFFNRGFEMVDGWKIENAEKRSRLYGEITMKEAFYWSLNTGSIKALKLLGDDAERITPAGREKLYDYYHNRFRLGQMTGVELAEAKGLVADPQKGQGRDSVYANMTFGQNIHITMMQTATAFSAVVNGGRYVAPTVVAGEMVEEDFVEVKRERQEEQVVKEETSAMMRAMLVNNRDYKVRQGIDRAGYAVGGKSGTAQVIKNGAYDKTMSELVGSYIGFGGTNGELPKYVIMVKIWGEGKALDGGKASDSFDKISNFLINYLKIKPKG